MLGDFATVRLRAERLAAKDLDELIQLHLDPEICRYLGGVRSPDATAAYLETNLGHWTDHGFGLWTLRTHSGRFVGRAGLRYIDLEGARELEIAYTLVKDAWGQALATEITGALVDLWMTELAEPCLVGIVSKGHAASERVLLKTGFSRERSALYHNVDVGVFRRARSAIANEGTRQGRHSAD